MAVCSNDAEDALVVCGPLPTAARRVQEVPFPYAVGGESGSEGATPERLKIW